VLTIVLTICGWLPLFWMDNKIIIDKYSLFSSISAIHQYKFLSFSLAVVLISFQAIYLNYVVNQFKLVDNNTHLVSLFYVLLSVSNTSLLIVNHVLIVNTFLLFTLHQLFRMYNTRKDFTLAFNTGLLTGLITLIYYPAILIFPLVWIVLIYTKTPHWREFVISVLGLLLPVVFYVTYYFLTDQLTVLINSIPNNYVVFGKEQLPATHIGRSFFYVLVVVGFFSGINLIKQLDKNVVKIRKLLLVVVVMMILLTTSLLINSFDYFATFLLLATPLSILLACYFNQVKRSWLAEMIFLCLLGTLIVSYFS